METEYTIIIPHKNCPKLLQRCLDTIPRKEEIQIIVIDDNSDPEEVDFSIFPGLHDPYVEIIYGKNENGRKGAGYARNLGLERAKGKWLIFADADDFFNPCFEEELNRYVHSSYDLILFHITSVNSDTLRTSNRGNHYNSSLSCAENAPNSNAIRFSKLQVWGKFISKKLVESNHICFQETFVANDMYFSLMLGIYAEKIHISTATTYCLTYRKNSLETTETLNRHKEYFNTTCAIYSKVKHLAIDKSYLQDSIYYWWKKIKNDNILFAVYCAKKLIACCGFGYIMRQVLHKLKTASPH
jgi:glycosyltransferase involved in cell wall biosynthesis